MTLNVKSNYKYYCHYWCDLKKKKLTQILQADLA